MDTFFNDIFLFSLLAYLIGSIPFGLVLVRVAGKGDIRAQGSGNIGATNVLRVGGKTLAVATLLLDILKGYLAVAWLAPPCCDALWHTGAVALGVFLGHLFPVWLRFRGGKGVATACGVLMALSPLTALAAAFVWALAFAAKRISSLASLSAAIIAPVCGWIVLGAAPALLILILCVLIIARHRANIRRLLNGTEHSFRTSA